MSDDDPLAGLDDVAWAELRHAYGRADDVPGHVRALRSADAEEREEAWAALSTSVVHQGTRYEAAAPAVPFLLALAADPATPDRDALLYLLTALAIGLDEAFLPAGVDAAAWRTAVAELRAADSPDDEQDEEQDEERRADARFAEAGLAAYDAVRAGVPVLLTLLTDPAPEVRAAAAFTLAWFPEEAGVSRPALRALLAAETAPGVIANAVIAAGLLDGHDLVPELRALLAGEAPPVRWAAAVALARLGAADAAVVAGLTAWAAAASCEPFPSVVFFGGDLRALSAVSLAALGGEVPAEAAEAVLGDLSRTTGVETFPVAAAALRLAFGEPPSAPLPPFADLTGLQRRTVTVLASLPAETWQWVNLLEILRAWGLPTGRSACRAYAGLT